MRDLTSFVMTSDILYSSFLLLFLPSLASSISTVKRFRQVETPMFVL